MKILVTGFSAFPGVPVNPCEEVLAWIKQIYPVETIGVCTLPVSYRRSASIVAEIIEEKEPLLVIELGVSSRTIGVRLESVGYNARNASIPDVDGICGSMESIDNAMPYNCVKETAWPLEALSRHLQKVAPCKVEVSTDPGRYVCNNLYWETLHQFPAVPSLFVHIPFLNDNNRPSMLSTIGLLLDWSLSMLREQSGV